MPYSRPTLTALNTEALQDIQAANISGVDGLLKRAVLRVLAWAMAGLSYEHYGYQDWIALQAVPWTATGEYLEGWAALRAVVRKPATTASLTATFIGTPGAAVAAGAAMSTGNAVAFTATAAASIAAGATSLTIGILSTGTGTSNNLAVGTVVTLATPIPGINASGVVASVVTEADDLETDDELRTRMLQVYANPPQGGAASDYETWALAVPGVTRAWCNPLGMGVGTAVVFFMMDNTEAAFGGFPQGTNGVAAAETRAIAATGDQLAVANAIYPLRPVTALVYASAPAGAPINFAIQDLSPSTISVAEITAALADLFVRIGTPLGMTVYPSDWNEAIASVVGSGHFFVASPSAPVTIAVGSLPTVGNVTATN